MEKNNKIIIHLDKRLMQVPKTKNLNLGQFRLSKISRNHNLHPVCQLGKP